MLTDETNREIPLTMHKGEGTTGPAFLTVEPDFDSSLTPSEWVWLMFDHDEEPWFRLTYEEAERLHSRLGLILGK